MKRGGLDKATYEFIQCLIYRKMWDSDRRWKKAGEVKKKVRALKLKKDKEKLKINDSFIDTRIRYLSEFDLVREVNIKELRWYGGVVEKISDGTWVNA